MAIASPAFNSPWGAGENSHFCLGNVLSRKGKSSLSLPITDHHSPALLSVSTGTGAAVAREGAEERMEGAAPVWGPQLLNCLWSFSGKVMASKCQRLMRPHPELEHLEQNKGNCCSVRVARLIPAGRKELSEVEK